MKHERALAYTAFAIVCLVWGTTYLAIRVAVETIPPLLLTSIRYTIAGLLMFAVARARGESIPRDRATLGNLAVIGILLVSIGNMSVIWAEQWVPSGMAALFVATAPFWMATMEAFRPNGERLTTRSVAGMLIGFVGVALLVTPGGAGQAFDSQFLLGALAIQVGSIAWQYGTLRGKYHLAPLPMFISSSLQMLIGGVAVGIVGLAIGEADRFRLTPRTAFAAAYLTIFGSVIAYSAYVYALSRFRTTQMSLYAYINPAVAVLLGWLILGEEMTWVSVVAMTVILSGVALVQGAKKQPLPRTVEEKRAA